MRHRTAELVLTSRRAHTRYACEKFDDLSQRVGVLHEDVKRDFRFSLEAQQGLKEQMEASFAGR